MLRRLVPYFRPHLASLLLAVACMGVVSMAVGGQVFLIRHVFDGLLVRHDRKLLALLPPAIILLYGLQAAGEVGRGFLSRRVGQRIIFQLRNELFRHYQHLSIDYLQDRAAGAMMSRVTHDVEAVQRAVTAFITLLQKPLTLAVLIAAAAWQEPGLTLLALIGLPVVVYPIDALGKRLRAYSRQAMDTMGELNSILQESIAGARIVRAFGMESAQIERFERENARQHRLQLKATRTMLLSGPIVQVIAACGAAAILWFGGLAVMEGRSTPGSLLAFLVSLGLMNDPLKSLAQVPMLLSQTRVGMERVAEVLDAAPTVRERAGALELVAARCEVRFERVSFSHGEQPVLKEIDLEAGAGEVVALVGPSGAGKSTILNLILRFYDAQSGAIKINGIDVRDLTLSSLRRHIGIVTQDTFLFNDTIRANIVAGRPGATEQELEAAARLAHADGFIRSLPQGYDTPVGDRGLRLSGGQRQRIAIARALLKDAPILLLDEATSALDQQAEEEVQRALETLIAHRTTFVVAHRLSTVRGADRIVVLEEGRIVESGDHASLIANKTRYAGIYARQMGWGRLAEPGLEDEEVSSSRGGPSLLGARGGGV